MYRTDARRGYYPLLAILLLSLATLLRAQTSLEFFFSWELMTLSSYLLITLGREGVKPALSYLLFSLASAYFIMAGLALAFALAGGCPGRQLFLAGEGDGAGPLLRVVLTGVAVVVVTHDLAVARLLASRVMVMQGGRVVETGLSDQVLDDPQAPYSQLLVSSVLQV